MLQVTLHCSESQQRNNKTLKLSVFQFFGAKFHATFGACLRFRFIQTIENGLGRCKAYQPKIYGGSFVPFCGSYRAGLVHYGTIQNGWKRLGQTVYYINQWDELHRSRVCFLKSRKNELAKTAKNILRWTAELLNNNLGACFHHHWFVHVPVYIFMGHWTS